MSTILFETLGCSTRLLNVLRRQRVDSPADLDFVRFQAVAATKGLGRKSLGELIRLVVPGGSEVTAHFRRSKTARRSPGLGSLPLPPEVLHSLEVVGVKTIADLQIMLEARHPDHAVATLLEFVGLLGGEGGSRAGEHTEEQVGHNPSAGYLGTRDRQLLSRVSCTWLNLPSSLISSMEDDGVRSVAEGLEWSLLRPAATQGQVQQATQELAELFPSALQVIAPRASDKSVAMSRGRWSQLLAVLSSTDLDAELVSLAAGFSDRDVDIWKARFPSAAAPRPTLEELGDRYGVSRERARQLEKRVSAQVDGSRFRLPRWTSFVQELGKRSDPWFRYEVAAAYRAAGGKPPDDLPSLLAELSKRGFVPPVCVADEPPVVFVGLSIERWVTTRRHERFWGVFRRIANREARWLGMVHRIPETLVPTQVQESIVAQIVGPSVTLLRTVRAWYFDPMVPSPVEKTIRKCFSVRVPFPRSKLVTGIPALLRQGTLRPSEVEQILRASSEFTSDPSAGEFLFYSGDPVPLSDAESASVRLAMERGGVLSWVELRELMEEAGWSVPTVHNCLRMPWFTRISPGVYALVGHEGNRDRIAAVKRMLKDRPSLVIRDELLANGVYFMEYTFRGRVADGVLPTPRFLRSEDATWRVDAGSASLGVTLRNGFVWSVSDWLESSHLSDDDTFGALFTSHERSIVLSTDPDGLFNQAVEKYDDEQFSAMELMRLLGGDGPMREPR